jgi:hypothetical protein
VATLKAPLLDGELLEHVSTEMNTTEEAMQCMQKRFRSHGNEPPKRDSCTVEGGDLHTVRPEPTSGRELTNRRHETNRTQNKKSEVKPLVYVVSSLFVVAKCFIYNKMVLQLIVVPPG